MNKATLERQQLIEAINTLPDEAIFELAYFLDYLRYKTSQPKTANNDDTNFLLSVAALGRSNQNDVSERDEEILSNEVDPIRGWNIKLNERQ